ncbi:MAG: AfsR family transcriptional regulator, partial [Solirubrobacteraceae bacterium]
DIATKLPDRLPAASARSVPARQRTMSASIEWSWRLLSADEQRLLACLALLPGDWDLAAAEEICVPSASPDIVRSLVNRLAEASLLTAELAASPTRYRMLRPVREFARERAKDAIDASALRGRHAEHQARVVASSTLR